MDGSVPPSLSPHQPRNIERVEMRMLRATDRRPLTLREQIGFALVRARSIVGWTQDQLAWEIAAALDRPAFDSAQISRWEKGKERLPIEVVLAVPQMVWPMVRCLAQLDAGSEVEVIEQIRRKVS